MLNVYRASAGSGKTYRLTYEYIKMLLGRRNEGNDLYTFYSNYSNAHRRILAVTFTNKATEEMKQRIVSQLDILAHNPRQSDYFNDLCNTFACDEKTLQHNVSVVLQQLLQDFSFFSISTIDSFFQQILRAFTREVGLQGGYDVELDSAYVTLAAIDRLFDNLDKEKDEKLFEWMLKYAREQIYNGGSWNIHSRSDLPDMAKQLTSEEYKKYSHKLRDIKISDYEEYIDMLDKLREQCGRDIALAARQVYDTILEHNVAYECFNRGWIKNIDILCDEERIKTDSKLLKEAFTLWQKKINAPDTWFAKSKLKNLFSVEQLTDIFSPTFQNLYSVLKQRYIELASVDKCKRHIYAMGVLSIINEYIAEYTQERNTILLSDTPDILRGLINKSDAPFIYEKIGTRISHYMIDEFQDTSNLQWNNFEPLINESLAYNSENLIVGDVKQSIYRWRNSDWRLLHNGLDNFDYTSMTTGHDTNWRSCAGVIAFNNSFFKTASHLLQDIISTRMSAHDMSKQDEKVIGKIYENVAQKVSKKHLEHSGKVDLHILKKLNSEDFEEKVLERLPSILEDLLQRGYRPKDIAILVRYGHEGCKIVELLLSLAAEHNGLLRNIKVVSDDSLLLGSAPPIKLIVGVLRYIHNPRHDINRLILAYEQGTAMQQGAEETLAHYFESNDNNELFGEELALFFKEISSKPLFEMCECIIHKFNMHHQCEYIAYIEAFQDAVIDYCRNHSSDLYSFLRWWSEKEKTLTVKSPANLDAITVSTIHKSKGLEYPVVIVPFAHWPMSSTSRKGNNAKWYEPEVAPFNRMPVLPIEHHDDLASTIFAPQYFKELVSEYVDNINLAYVAFTRAGQELIMYTRTPSRGGGYMLGELINSTLNMPVSLDNDCPYIDFATHCTEDDNEKVFTIGEAWQPLFEEEATSIKADVAYGVILPTKNRLKQRTSAVSVSGDRQRNKGVLMHEILSLIYTADDVEQVVQQYVREGKVRKRHATDMIRELTSLITQPQAQRWFSHEVNILNECDIIIPDKSVKRPDRIVVDGDKVVVIDYKFGRVESEEYLEQVEEYMQYMRDMGYSHVEGYVWYTTLNKFVPIT